MIVHLIFVARANWIIHLKDFEFPDGMSNLDLRNYLVNEWEIPTELFEDFVLPPDMKLRIMLSPISVERNRVLIFLVAPSPDVTLVQHPAPMTPDQTEVLNWMKKGLSIRQIARAMFRSVRWVQYRVAEIKKFHNVKNRHDLAVKIDSRTYLRMRRTGL